MELKTTFSLNMEKTTFSLNMEKTTFSLNIEKDDFLSQQNSNILSLFGGGNSLEGSLDCDQ